MPDRELTESGVFMWSRERELVPVYDRLAVLGATTECIAEIQELCAAHKDKIADCDALLAAIGVMAPGDYLKIEVADDVEEVVRVIWSKENEVLDGGWLRIDPLIEDENARAILIRGPRRHARH